MPLDPTEGLPASIAATCAASGGVHLDSQRYYCASARSQQVSLESHESTHHAVLFRAHFNVGAFSRDATIYIAGPREALVYLNGQLLGDFTSNVDAPINFHVFHAGAGHALKQGDNVLASRRFEVKVLSPA